jgi:hypothetical protein
MKFLKQKTLSKFSPNDQTLFATNQSRAVMNLTGALRLPKGTGDTAYSEGTVENQRPVLSGVRTLNGANGYIRYNTTTDVIEAYINGTWEIVRGSGSKTVVKQQIGPGDAVERYYGPLKQLGVNYTPPIPAAGGTLSTGVYDYPIMVLVENVMQISSENYTVVTNPAGTSSATGYLAGAAYPAGTYLDFGASPLGTVPVGKYVTIYYGYNN